MAKAKRVRRRQQAGVKGVPQKLDHYRILVLKARVNTGGKLFEPELSEPKCIPDRSVRDGAERASRARYSPA
jgi:hypothetical protein